MTSKKTAKKKPVKKTIVKKNLDANQKRIMNFIANTMSEINPEALYPSDMMEAVVGYVERAGMPTVILLDRKKCIECLMKNGISDESEAEEYFEFNTIGAYVGDGTPCFATFIKDIKI